MMVFDKLLIFLIFYRRKSKGKRIAFSIMIVCGEDGSMKYIFSTLGGNYLVLIGLKLVITLSRM
jgi:hypothetical protein